MNKWEWFLQMEAALFDLDGSLYYGEQPAEGATELLHLLNAKGLQIAFVTNNSTHTAVEVAAKLRRMSLSALPDQVITATEACSRYVLERMGRCEVKIIGSEALAASFRSQGFEVVPMESALLPQCVIVGRDTAFTYAKLEEAIRCIDFGARLIVANSDVSHPGIGGRRVPETGALAAAIIAAVGGIQAEYAGKPGDLMFRMAMERCGSTAATTVMIGDNPSTDIVGARNLSMRAVWISNGRAGDSSPSVCSAGVEDDVFIVANIKELLQLIAR